MLILGPLEQNTHAWQPPAHHGTTREEGEQENEKGQQQIQMKDEIRRSNCDKGVEAQNYRVKESRKMEKKT